MLFSWTLSVIPLVWESDINIYVDRQVWKHFISWSTYTGLRTTSRAHCMCAFFSICLVNNSSIALLRPWLTLGLLPSSSFVKLKAPFLQQRGPVWGACLDLSLLFVCFLFVSLWGNLAPEPWLPLTSFGAPQHASP